MPIAKVTCPACGELEVDLSTVQVCICQNFPERSFFRFDCPLCEQVVTKPASPAARRLLVSEASVAFWQWTPELDERHDGPPITLDDLIDLHFDLEDFA